MLFKSFIFHLSFFCGYAFPTEDAQQSLVALSKTLNALDRALDWIYSQHEKVNLDTLIGSRIVEGQLGVLLSHMDHGNGLLIPADYRLKIQNLYFKADRVSNETLPFVRINQPEYYYRTGPIIQHGFWTLDKPSKDVDRLLINPIKYDGEAIHETQSDDCLAEIFGTGEIHHARCDVSEKCWNTMTSPGYSGYSLSHEVFYLEIGQQFGCFDAIHGQPTIDNLTSEFCANMFAEYLDIAGKDFPEKHKDLSMEIAALCGVAGYGEFFEDVWLSKILSWQWGEGCWGLDPDTEMKQESPKNRFKREERRMQNGCLCHRTAVAIAALSQYVRYIAEFYADTVTAQLNDNVTNQSI